MVVIIGSLAWLFIKDRGVQQLENESKSSQSAPAIQLNIPKDALELAKARKALQISLKSERYQDIVRVEYLLDGKVAAYSTAVPFTVEINLSELSIGEHTLQAVAYTAQGKTSKSNIFIFTVADSTVTQPSGQSSEAIVSNSLRLDMLRRILQAKTLLANTVTNGGNSSNGGDNHGDETTSWPDTPPAQICGNSSILGGGPVQPPAGAIIVPAGDNNDMFFDFRQPNKTFWFAPGTHTMGNDQFGQIQPGDNSTFIGAPGAILDGQSINNYAFTGAGQNVTIRYFTVQNFVAPQQEGVVNHNDGRGWTVEYSTIQNNSGAGMMLGESNNTYRYNCIKDNGQYGINGCCGTPQNEVSNNTIDHNEITGNNTDDWETQIPGCGCTGAMKLWENASGIITNNYIHSNNGAGIWLDNNNRSIEIEGNYIADNHAEAIFVEAGYDTQIRYNNIKRNNIEPGRQRAINGDKFPVAAIYFSEAGSPANYGLTHVPTLVSHNNFEDNWSGVILWESPDRYSGSSANTHTAGTIKIPGGIYDTSACDGPNDTIPSSIANKYDCRWSTENIIVEHNTFRINKQAVGANCDNTNYCGINALFSAFGTYPAFPGYEVSNRLTFQQGNIFRNNHYYGPWHFAGFERAKADGSRVSWEEWTAPAPQPPYNFDGNNRPQTFGQDQGSVFHGPNNPPPPSTANYLDTNTATLEGSLGQWVSWFSSNIQRSSSEAHAGSHSMKIDITAPFGWGVILNNWPGFAVNTGDKTISFWSKLGSGSNLQVRLEAQWHDINQTLLRTDTLLSPVLTTTWQQTSTIVTPPAGAATVNLVLSHGSGTTGNSLYVDDIVVGDN